MKTIGIGHIVYVSLILSKDYLTLGVYQRYFGKELWLMFQKILREKF